VQSFAGIHQDEIAVMLTTRLCGAGRATVGFNFALTQFCK